MSLPLPTETFVRMADVTPASSNIQGLLDAIYASLGAVVDYRGTAVPATHQWVVNRQQNVGVTECVYVAPPAGTLMTKNPLLLIAGAAAGAPSMASPDVFTASNVLMGIIKNPGAWSSWTAAAPATSGSFSGYWRAFGTTWNSNTASVRCFVSAEQIFVQLINAAGTGQGWLGMGAILEPFTSYAASGGSTAETDDRLYGMWATGPGASVPAGWQTTNVNGAPFQHSTSNAEPHGMVFQPGSANRYNIGRLTLYGDPGSFSTDYSGAIVAIPFGAGIAGAAYTYQDQRMGMYRGISTVGALQSGRTIRNGGVDMYHVISYSTVGAVPALLLAASP